jgi:uncharacterized protein YjbI with pentapeptide repeats
MCRFQSSLGAISFAWLQILVTATAVRGGIQVADDPYFGIGSITRDSTNGLDWLDWTLTTGISYNEMSLLLSTDVYYRGWRYATVPDFARLSNSAGVPPQYNGQSLSIPDSHIQALASSLGRIELPWRGYNGSSSAFTNDVRNGYVTFVGIHDNYFGYYGVSIPGGAAPVGYSYPEIGNALVRKTVGPGIRHLQTGEVIAGTEQIRPVTGIDLSNWNTDTHNLRFADFTGALVLVDAHLSRSWLDNAHFDDAYLVGADFVAASLTSAVLRNTELGNANLNQAKLANASLTGAIVAGADFGETTAHGFTKDQLYSTASYDYQAHNLSGVNLSANDLSGWNFATQDLTHANLSGSTLISARLSGADLSEADAAGSQFNDAILSGARLRGASLIDTQFVSANLASAELSAANLTGTRFDEATLSGARLQDAIVINGNFEYANLTGADLRRANLTRANFNSATLVAANLAGAVVSGVSLASTTTLGFTRQQLYATRSYQEHDLRAVDLSHNDLSGWNFAGQNLTGAIFDGAVVTGASFVGADTRGSHGLNLTGSSSRNTILSMGTIVGLDLVTGERLVVRNYLGDPNHGLPPIPINVNEQMTLADGGTLEILLDAARWNSTISFQREIQVVLDGTLQLSFAADVDADQQIGRSFDLFDWTGVSPTGQFEVASTYTWDLSNLYTSGEVTLTAIVPGDFNFDGTVDAADYIVWRKDLGTSYTLADYNAWRAHFGAGSAGLGAGSGVALPSAEPLSAAVPEPTTIALLTAIAIVGPLRCRRCTAGRTQFVMVN